MLPAYQINPMLDVSPISNALTGYQKQMNTNDQLNMEDRKVSMQEKAFDDQQKQQAIERVGRAAKMYFDLPANDPRRGAIGAGLLRLHPNMATELQNAGIDTNNHDTVAKFLLSQTAGYDPTAEKLKLAQIGSANANTAQSNAQLQQLKMQTPDWRMQNAGRFGIDVNTPEGKAFVISGQYTPKTDITTVNEGQTIGQISRDANGQSTFRPIVKGVEKPPPEHTAKAANFAARMVEAERNVRKLLDGVDPISGDKGLKFGAADKSVALTSPLPEVVRNMVISGPHQQYRQAAEQWIRAFLRKESGAAIGADEFKRDFVVYFPQPGDGPDVIAQKANARAAAMSGIAGEAGNYFSRLNPDAAKNLEVYKGGAVQQSQPQPTRTQAARPRAVNSQTGQAIEFDGTRWVPAQ